MSLTLHTSLGDLKLELAVALVPRLATNFLALAASGAYDGSALHRVVRGFIAQGGDAAGGSGKGGLVGVAGMPLADEALGVPALRHAARGVLAMANQGVPDTNGAQFYLTFAPQPSLDGKSCVIGRVCPSHAASWATLDRIEAVEVRPKKFRPLEDVVVERVTIHANPLAPV